MTATLADYFVGHSSGRFQSKPQYFREGDFVTFFLKQDLAYAKRLGGVVTVYLSEETGEMVGCKIKSVRALLELLGDFKIYVRDDTHDVNLGMLFFAASSEAETEEIRLKYRQLARQIGDASIDRECLPSMAA